MKVDGTNINIVRGDTGAIEVGCNDEHGEPMLFEVGDVVYFTVKNKPTDEEIVLQKAVTSFDNGKATIELNHADTKDLPFKKYVYDIQWTRYNGDVHTLVRPSDFLVDFEVTYD